MVENDWKREGVCACFIYFCEWILRSSVWLCLILGRTDGKFVIYNLVTASLSICGRKCLPQAATHSGNGPKVPQIIYININSTVGRPCNNKTPPFYVATLEGDANCVDWYFKPLNTFGKHKIHFVNWCFVCLVLYLSIAAEWGFDFFTSHHSSSDLLPTTRNRKPDGEAAMISRLFSRYIYSETALVKPLYRFLSLMVWSGTSYPYLSYCLAWSSTKHQSSTVPDVVVCTTRLCVRLCAL